MPSAEASSSIFSALPADETSACHMVTHSRLARYGNFAVQANSAALSVGGEIMQNWQDARFELWNADKVRAMLKVQWDLLMPKGSFL